jgi:hypothetical protein
MAYQPMDTVSASTINFYVRKARDDIFMSTALMEFLLNTIKPVDGGLNISYPIIYTVSPQADAFPGGVSQLSANFIPNTTQATWAPAFYYGAIGIPDTVAILNQGQSSIVDIVEAQFEQMVMSLVNRLGQDVFLDGTSRNSSVILQGLNAVCTNGSDPGGGAYGGVTRSGSSGTFKAPVGSAAWWNAPVLSINGGPQTVWKGVINPGTSTTMSYNALFALTLAGMVGMYRPQAYFTDVIGFQAIGNLFVAIARESSLETVFKQGARGLSFSDTPIFQDDQCTSGYVYAVNDMFELRVWRNALFAVSPWRQPSNALVNILYMLLTAQLIHSRPNTMPVLTGITG